MKNYLIVTALCSAETPFVSNICKLLAKTGCNLVNCQMKILGTLYAITLLIEGSWDALAKAENGLTQFNKKFSIHLFLQRTELLKLELAALPYFVQVVALDKAGIVAEITDFFAQENITISELETSVQISSYTGSNIFTLNMVIYIPENIIIADLRERFILFCDTYNLDAVIEPVK